MQDLHDLRLNTFSLSKSLPDIGDVKPLGSYVYVEVLSSKEILKTNLTLTGNTEVPVNEAYILGVGPLIPKDYGLQEGQRVFIDGGITFGPNYGGYTWTNEGRKRGMVLYSAIKGHIVEKP